MAHDYGHVPLAFEPNEGQFDPRIRYVSRSSAYTLFLTDQDSVITLPCSAAPCPEGMIHV